jgi:hypothetical protein
MLIAAHDRRQNNAADLDDRVQFQVSLRCRAAGSRLPLSFRLLHTSAVQLISSVWRIGLPGVIVAGSALALVDAVRSREKPGPMSRVGAALAVLVWLRLAGEAALGDHRPVFERQWKGAAAILLAAAGAILLWQRYGRRDGETSKPVPAQNARPTPPGSAILTTAHSVTMPALGDRQTSPRPP